MHWCILIKFTLIVKFTMTNDGILKMSLGQRSEAYQARDIQIVLSPLKTSGLLLILNSLFVLPVFLS